MNRQKDQNHVLDYGTDAGDDIDSKPWLERIRDYRVFKRHEDWVSPAEAADHLTKQDFGENRTEVLEYIADLLSGKIRPPKGRWPHPRAFEDTIEEAYDFYCQEIIWIKIEAAVEGRTRRGSHDNRAISERALSRTIGEFSLPFAERRLANLFVDIRRRRNHQREP